MTAVITIANQKGGESKTTTARHLTCVLAAQGKRVLVVDNDRWPMRALILLLACLAVPATAQTLFPNSVVSNDLDYIRPADPTLFACLIPRGTDRREMPDKRSDTLFAEGVAVVEARFHDGTAVEITAHPDLAQPERAALPLAEALGRLPGPMRARLSHVVLHDGAETAFAEDQGRFFVIYAGNMARRLGTHDLDETVFHESVHATLDIPHAASEGWRRAQARDAGFVTEYAAALPDREDLAETALFAFALFHHPGRLPAAVEAALQDNQRHRLAYLFDLFAEMGPYPAPRRASGCP